MPVKTDVDGKDQSRGISLGGEPLGSTGQSIRENQGSPRLLPHGPVLVRRVLVAGLFLLFAVVELWSPIAHGTYLFPGDIGQKSPITRQPTASDSIRNPLQSDVYVDLGPFLHFDVTQVEHQGVVPLWNPDNGNGEPYLADDQTMVFSPFTIPFYLFGSSLGGFRLALLASALAKLWLIGFFTYLFLVRSRLPDLAAVVAGALFAYAGYHLVWLEYQHSVSVAATLAVALWCLRVGLDNRGAAFHERRRRRFALLGLAVCLGAFVYEGHPETTLFDTLLVALYAVVAVVMEPTGLRARVGWLLRVGGVGILALGLSAFQLLPFLQYVSEGARPAQLRANPAASVAGFLPDTVAVVAFPNLFGGPQFAYSDGAFYSRHFPQDNYAEVDGNVTGLLALCLLPLGLLGAWQRRREVIAWFGVLAALVDTVALYTRFAGLWWHHLPFVDTAGLNRSQDIQLMGIAVLGALGLDWVLGQRRPQRRVRQHGAVRPTRAVLPHEVAGGSTTSRTDIRGKWTTVGAVIVSFGVVAGVLLALAKHLRDLVSHLPGSTASTPVALSIVRDDIAAECAIAAGFAMAMIIVVLAGNRRRRAKYDDNWESTRRGRRSRMDGTRSAVALVAALAMCLLAFASNGLVMRSYNPAVPADEMYPKTAAVTALTRLVGSQEVLFADRVFPSASANLWFGLNDVGSYDAIAFRWQAALYDEVFHTSNLGKENMPDCRTNLQLFAVRWVVGGTGRYSGTTGTGLTRTTSIKGVAAYAVPGSSEVSLVGSAISDTDGDGRALHVVGGCGFHPDSTVVLNSSAYAPDRPGHLGDVETVGPAGEAQVVSRSTNALTVKATSAKGGWLVVRQAWAPGWTASVGGRNVPVVRADIAFQAVRLPPGTQFVHLVYAPAAVGDGAVISILSVAVVMVAGAEVLWETRTRRRIAPLSKIARSQ
jgi:hypothetical protein